MKKESFYKIAIAFLILINLLQVWGRFTHHRDLKSAKQSAVDKMELNENQAYDFFELVKKHRKSMVDLHEMQQEYTKAYFKEPTETLLKEVILMEEQKIKITAQHFAKIKSILNEDQYDNFEKFKNKAVENILLSNTTQKPRK